MISFEAIAPFAKPAIEVYRDTNRSYFYICGTYNCPGSLAISASFEARFARFEYVGANQFNVAHMRHTEQWWEFLQGLSLEDCLHEMRTK